MPRDNHVVLGVRVRFLTGQRTGHQCEFKGPQYDCTSIARFLIAPERPMPPTAAPWDSIYHDDYGRTARVSYAQGWAAAQSTTQAVWHAVCPRHLATACTALRDGRALVARGGQYECAVCGHSYTEHAMGRSCEVCEDAHIWKPKLISTTKLRVKAYFAGNRNVDPATHQE